MTLPYITTFNMKKKMKTIYAKVEIVPYKIKLNYPIMTLQMV